MSWLDIAIILILLASTTYSIYRGLIKEFFSFISLFAGYVAANNLYLPLKISTKNFFSPDIPAWGFYIFIFILTLMLVSVFGLLVRKAMHISVTLKIVDSMGGGIAGLLKGVLILSLLILPLSSYSFSRPLLKRSIIPQYLIKSFKIISTLSSSDLIQDYEQNIADLKKRINTKMIKFGKEASNKEIKKTIKSLTSKEDISKKDRLKLENLIKNSIK